MTDLNIYTVVVTWNGDHWIKQCLSSLLASDLPTKIIVVDNNSTDTTCETIEKQFPEVELVRQNENLGFGKANNVGLKQAISKNADYVFLLNQDAWIRKDTIAKLVVCHEANLDYGIISPIQLNANNQLDTKFEGYLSTAITPGYIMDFESNNLKELYSTKFVNAAAWLLPRNTLEIVGRFNPIFFHYGEDDEYLNRCRYHNLEIGICTTTSITHDRHQDLVSISSFPYSKLKEYMRNHMLIDMLDPNIRIGIKVKRLFIHIMKGLVRNPIVVVHTLFLLFSTLSKVKVSYRESIKANSYNWESQVD